jgi:hypothetical protein
VKRALSHHDHVRRRINRMGQHAGTGSRNQDPGQSRGASVLILIEYGHFGVAVRNVSKDQAEARNLIKFMTSPEAAALLRKSAMEPPAK